MNKKNIRDLGKQPIARIMVIHALKANDLVSSSTEHITHKMVSRAVKGRRLTPHVRCKILNALNTAARTRYSLEEIFNY